MNEKLKQSIDADLLNALRDLTKYVVRNCCLHEETHRGGILWEICDRCGAMWADDEGGIPPEAKEYSKEIKIALCLLEKFEANNDRKEK